MSVQSVEFGNRPVDQLKMTELREELKRRKISTGGLKVDLVKRLEEALCNEIRGDDKIKARTMLQGRGGARTRDLFQEKSILLAGKLQFPWRIRTLSCHPLKYRRLLIFVGTTLGGSLLPSNFLHTEEGKEDTSLEKKSDNDDDEGLVGGLLSLFNPNEKTKSRRVLPKSYVKSVREVAKNLRELLKEDVKDAAKFRRTTDSAKEAIRDFMQNWTGQKSVASEIWS